MGKRSRLCLGCAGAGLDRVQTDGCTLCNCLRVCIWISYLRGRYVIKFLYAADSGLVSGLTGQGVFPGCVLFYVERVIFCMLLAMVCANLLQCLSCVLI